MINDNTFRRVGSRRRYYNNSMFNKTGIIVGSKSHELFHAYNWIDEHTEGDFCIENKEVRFKNATMATMFALGYSYSEEK